MHNYLNIYHYGIAKDVLGFGNRLVIWVAGCPFTCHGCIEEKLQPDVLGRKTKITDVRDKINNGLNKISGITFSGGEPLWQSRQLIELFEILPREIDKMLFTGYIKSELNEVQIRCYDYFDLVVDGRYVENKTGNFLWRGSSNQRFYSPTKKYSNILDELHASKSVGLDIHVKRNEMYFYGIPTSNDEIGFINNSLTNSGLRLTG